LAIGQAHRIPAPQSAHDAVHGVIGPSTAIVASAIGKPALRRVGGRPGTALTGKPKSIARSLDQRIASGPAGSARLACQSVNGSPLTPGRGADAGSRGSRVARTAR